MKIRILRSASRDLVDGWRFYATQADGICDYFLDSLYSDIDSLVLAGGAHQRFFGRYHRMLSKRFPFAVYYRIEADTVIVIAVLDCRREPAWIRRRLEAGA